MTRSVRAVLVAAALACALVLAACGSDSGSGSSSGSSDGAATTAARPTGTIKVVALSLGAPGDRSPMRIAARAFEAANPGTKVDVTMYDFTTFDQAVRAQINGGSPPDVVQSVLGYGSATSVRTLAGAGALTDLSDQPWVASIPEEAKGPSGLDGKIYAYPPMYGLIGAFYDQKVLDRLGLTAPTTYDELLSYCDAAKARGITPISLGAQTPIATVFLSYALAASTAYLEAPDFNQERLDGKTTFAKSRGWLQSLEQLQELDRKGCFGDSPTAVPYQGAIDAVTAGKAGMVVLTIEGLPALKAGNPRGDFKMIALPSNDDAAQTKIPAAPSAGFAIPTRAKNPALAKAFIAFMAQQDNSISYAEGVGSVPVAGIGDARTAKFPPEASAMRPYVAEGRSMIYPSQYWPAPEVNNALMAGITGMLTGQKSPEDIVKAMDAAWKAP